MKRTNILFIVQAVVFCLFTMNGSETVDEWTGIRSYWCKFSRHSTIYEHCAKTRNDQNCAIINAYLLVIAGDKKYLEQQLQSEKAQLHAVEKEISDNENSDFRKRHRLQADKADWIIIKNQSENRLHAIIKQLEMGDLSDNPQDNLSQKKLEHAFNSILSTKPCNIRFELDCLERAEKNALRRKVQNKGGHGSKVGNGWRYAATGPQDDDM